MLAMRRWLVLLLPMCIGSTFPVDAAIPASFQADRLQIDKQLAAIDADLKGGLKSSSPLNVSQRLRELELWIDELQVDADLSDTDPDLVALRQRLDRLRVEARAVQPLKAMKKESPSMDRDPLSALNKPPVNLDQVSFKRDVAPIIANVCLGCHNKQRASGEFDASTYDSFVTMITPGDPGKSHLLDLVTGKAQPRMPRGGQTVFQKDWLDLWTAWIKKGAPFDGPSRSAQITTYLIDLESQRRDAIRRMSPSDLEKIHRDQSRRQLQIVAPKDPVATVETSNFLVFTTLNKDDAEYIGAIAEAVVEELGQHVGGSIKQPIWPGRLALFVFAKRHDYLAFAREVDHYSPEEVEFGHVRLPPEHQYIALQGEREGYNLDGMVAQLVAEAFFRQWSGGKLPTWLVYGMARVEGARLDPKATAFKKEQQEAARLLSQHRTIEQVLEARVPWKEQAPLAASLANYLMAKDRVRAVAFLKRLSETNDPSRSIREVFGGNAAAIQAGWLESAVGRSPTRANRS